MEFARAACVYFGYPESALDNVVQALGNCLRAGHVPLALRCPNCATWHVDTGYYAATPHRTHVCHHCGCHFSSPTPCIGHPFSTLGPTLTDQTLTFGFHTLPTVSAAFDGMDHLAEESDITSVAEASAYLRSLGISETPGSDVLQGV